MHVPSGGILKLKTFFLNVQILKLEGAPTLFGVLNYREILKKDKEEVTSYYPPFMDKDFEDWREGFFFFLLVCPSPLSKTVLHA